MYPIDAKSHHLSIGVMFIWNCALVTLVSTGPSQDSQLSNLRKKSLDENIIVALLTLQMPKETHI